MVTELNILNLAFRPLSDEDEKEIGVGDEEVLDDDGTNPEKEDLDEDDDSEDGPEITE